MQQPGAVRWPQGKRGCMALAFDLDGPTGDAMLNGSLWSTPEYFTFGAYGPYRALGRLLDLLRAFKLPATFFVPAWVVEQWPQQCQAIIEQGHEVAYHGYRHESFWAISPEEQRAVMAKSAEIFKQHLGITACGFRTPSGDWHAETPQILREAGVIYSSSMRGDDRPYSIPVAGHTPLVEIPGKWEMDDYASLAYTRQPDFPKGGDRIASYAQTRDNWQREFDGAMDEGLCLTTLFHPKISGQPGRILLLEQLFEHMTARDDVWFARCDAVAQWFLQENSMTESSRWPLGFQSAALLTIDFNDIHGILTQAPAVAGRDKTLSVWRYGTLRGVDRLLTLLAEKQLKASWCIPAIVAEEQPELIARIVSEGHEIACSGDRHEDFSVLSLDQQIANVTRGCDKLAQLTGQPIQGFRTPAGQWKPGLAAALVEKGIRWSSSWRGDDLPYFHPGTRLVELPMHYTLEDEPYFAFNLSPAIPPGQSRIAPYAETLANMKQDFQGFHRFGLCYLLRLHPEIIGTAGRIGLLRELIETLQQHNVWIATGEQIAAHWQSQPDNDFSHPAEVFTRIIGGAHGLNA